MPHQYSSVVVGDDRGMRKALERLLRAAGFHAVLFPSAEALLETDAADSAGCLVLDIHLPGLSGFDLRRRLNASGHEPPVIFITAQDENPPAMKRGSWSVSLTFANHLRGLRYWKRFDAR